METYNICRICLSEEKHTVKMQPLFESDNSHCVDIIQKIKECVGIELKIHENYPKLICDQCLQLLDTSYHFRTMCQDSENAILNALVKSEPNTPEVNTSCSIEEPEIYFDVHKEITDEDQEKLDLLTNGNDTDDDQVKVDMLRDDSDADEEQMKLDMLTNSIDTDNIFEECADSLSGTTSDSEVIYRRKRSKKKKVNDQIMCDICGNIYPTLGKLTMHMRRHMPEKPFQCEICGKTFIAPSEVRRHMRVHTGEKPFVCKFCGQIFADRSTNIKHERIHTKERPFICNSCGKAFTYSNVLKDHMLTHTGEKPYSCAICKTTFTRKFQLNKHYATRTHENSIQKIKSLNNKSKVMLLEAENNL